MPVPGAIRRRGLRGLRVISGILLDRIVMIIFVPGLREAMYREERPCLVLRSTVLYLTKATARSKTVLLGCLSSSIKKPTTCNAVLAAPYDWEKPMGYAGKVSERLESPVALQVWDRRGRDV